MAAKNKVDDTFDKIDQLSDEQYFESVFDSEQFISADFEIEEIELDAVAANEDLWEILDISEDDWDAASEGGYLIF